MKPLKILLIIFSWGYLGCSSTPTQPALTLCQLDIPRSEGICGQTDIMGGEVIRVPLIELDKATALIPEEWEKLQNYIDILEQAIEK